MTKFKITTKDGSFVVDAPSAESAMEALDSMGEQNYTGPSDANGFPEGMIFDKATNRMVDAKAIADQRIPGGSRPGSWVKGMPFVGEYVDEAAGWLLGKDDPENAPNNSQAIETQVAREASKTYEKAHPTEALAGKIVTGLTAAPAAVELAPAAVAKLPLYLRTAIGAATGATVAGVEGTVSGYGEGEDKVTPRDPGPKGKFDGLLENGNIDLANRPSVKMDDGSTATVRSASFNIDGKEVLIPTVSNNGRLLSDAEALAQYKLTGKHLGKFDTPEHATEYAQKLHEAQDKFYNEGKSTSESTRTEKAQDRGTWSAAIGGVLGAATPVVSDFASSAAKWWKDKGTVSKQVKELGIDRPAADTITSMMKADDTLGPEGAKRIAMGGDDAMLADAGPTAAGLLDTTIQKGNLGGRIAQKAVQERAAKANNKLSATMDLVLGRPPGANQAAREIAEKSSAARQRAYDIAHSKPIDYASKEGRVIEDVFSRTPKSILKTAIDEANDEMVTRGLRNQQIMANIADDGTVTFRQMPNMRQVDELKKALGKIGSEVDDLGRKTPAAERASKLAKELRNAAMKAVPEYETAVKLGGDKIAEDNALRLGLKLLRPSTTREEVSDAVEDITGPERKQLGLGLRQYIDDLTTNVKKALSDPNQDAREAAAAFKEMSSRAAQEKMVAALGEERAKPLLKQLDEAEVALGLKAQVVQNSKTFARTETAKAVDKRSADSVWQQIKEVAPIKAVKAAGRKFTGMDEASQLARQEKIYADIAQLLTGPRGPDAQRALQRLEQAYKTGDLNAETARKIGEYIVGSTDVTAYQFATQPR